MPLQHQAPVSLFNSAFRVGDCVTCDELADRLVEGLHLSQDLLVWPIPPGNLQQLNDNLWFRT